MPSRPSHQFRRLRDLAGEAAPMVASASSLPTPIASSLAVADDSLPNWIDRLSQAGVRPDRCGCPNLLGQLQSLSASRVDVIVCTCFDTDPHLPLNAAWAKARTSELMAGLDLLQRLAGARRIVLAAESGLVSGSYPLAQAIAEHPQAMIFQVVADYPLNHPALLLNTLLDRKLDPDQLPTSASAFVVDPPAAVAVGELVLHGHGTSEVPLAVRDHVAGQAHLLIAPAGSTVGEVLQRLQIPSDHPWIRAGDFLRDQRIHADAIIGNGELTLHITAPELAGNPEACIRCAWCVDACPVRAQPAALLEAAQRCVPNLARRSGLDACIECGICSYVCPSRLPLLHAIRQLKPLPIGERSR